MQEAQEVKDIREAFLNSTTFAVAGASTQREKYGNIIYRALRDSGRNVYPINPRAEEVEGQVAYPDLLSLPVVPQAVSESRQFGCSPVRRTVKPVRRRGKRDLKLLMMEAAF
jgi:hypothetical protein